MRSFALALLFLLAAASGASAAPPKPDVIYVVTPQSVVDAMLEMAKVGPGDVLYDLGSGDGRIPITAAKRFGVRAVGIEIDVALVREASRQARRQRVDHLVSFRKADLFATDLSEASVVTLYLLDTVTLRLRPKLLSELKPGTRVVSHAFHMGDWTPDEVREIDGNTIYLWTIPPAK
ncbi:class I SAM-dependent methyltransferase [Caulobacter sp. 73W]|uniref:Class I SAM-dependent methyltransferase n=1 Tax=Caulobacter sp. 73W TaxID=3161137 RepID=A0AB39KS33_9CAUL